MKRAPIHVERILNATPKDPREFVELLGLEVGHQRLRDGCFVSCPAHAERTPSCTVAERDGRIVWHCKGCGAGGDAFDFVAARDGLDVRKDFPEVARRLAALVGVSIDTTEQPTPRPTPRPAPKAKPAPTHPRAFELDGELSGALLPVSSPHARMVADYLRTRGVLEEATADDWRALDLEELRHLITERVALGGDLDQSELPRAGLVDGGRPRRPRHVLVIPWRNADGSVTTLQRRVLDSSEPRYVAPPGLPPLAPYGADRLAMAPKDAPIAIVEGAIDVLARRAIDRPLGRVTLGVQGTQGWRAEWDHLARGREVYIAFDADKAGDEAAAKLAERFYAAGAARVRRARPVGAKDWADLTRMSA